jgi:hypothetical protein
MAIDTTNQITVEFTPVDTFQSTDILTLSGTTAVLNRLDGLDDVIEANTVANNMTLVYNSATDKYIVQELDLDGGTF